ncbi:Ger(x)C family spore germination protein [Paenibacillus sp. HJL G12]|uniref:Ger(X)C family spore germination protein n=1 Tax=Paenibacillus dendrobii TaxID=2691084 RepID=A0A7X3IH49_9BACL|nr:Ger(x)C family spore germination protein [Paenibacillus dendrobii]MWV43186.1 Ger(x)C family spore germination protein [Paenibacillus dendrobii]
MKKAVITLMLCTLLLTGCWDLKSVQDMNIVTAIGIDYQNGQYTVYGKLTDFSSISQSDTGGNNSKNTTWVGKGTGKTVNLAFYDLYPSAQHQTLWTHVKSIVLSDSALKHMNDIFEELLRSRDLRYTPWVYGTKDPIEDIFNAETTFNQSPLMLEMFEPREVYKQRSGIEPIRLQKLMDAIREPATTVLLPDISLSSKHWSTNHKKDSMMELKGVYAVQKGTNMGWVPEAELSGARLLIFTHVNRFPLNLEATEGAPTTLSLNNPTSKIRMSQKNGKMNFIVQVSMHANITESAWKKGLDEKQMKTVAEKKLQRDIIENFHTAKKQGIDLYQFEEWIYRHHYPLWKQKSSGGPLLPSIEIDNVEVKVKIDHSNTYKM